MMVMQMGQFLDHDITLTPEGHPSDECCSDEAARGGVPGLCFPIAVPCEDPTFLTPGRGKRSLIPAIVDNLFELGVSTFADPLQVHAQLIKTEISSCSC